MTHKIQYTARDVSDGPPFPGSSPLPTTFSEWFLGNAEVEVASGRGHKSGTAL
jgi:hypothetical protein